MFDMERKTFTFENTERPMPLEDSSEQKFCHDIELYGVQDSVNFPRLEQNEMALLFSKADPHFSDLDMNGKLDINDKIERELLGKYGEPKSIDLFHQLKFKFHPNQRANKFLGYVMDFFIEDYKAKCPTRRDYNSTTPIYRVLKNIIGADTEALYIAQEQGSMPNKDLLLIRESLLKKIKIRSRVADFYWPANTANPYRRHEGQRSFKLIKLEQLPQQDIYRGANVFPSHDKRIGCVPKFI